LIDLYPQAKEAGFSLTREEILDVVRKELSAFSDVVFAEADEVGATLRVRIFAPDNPSGDSQKIALSIKLSTGKTKHYFGSAPLDFSSKQDKTKIFAQAFAQGFQHLSNERRGVQQSTRILIGQIENYMRFRGVGKNQAMRALQSLGDLRAIAASGAIQALLKSPDEEVVRKALWTLSQIKDPESIDAISAYAERKPTVIRLSAIAVARSIGGHKAAAWLFTLSTGHPDADVREAAANAFQSIESQLTKRAEGDAKEASWEPKRKGT